jgi:hypothetical protein
MTTEEDNWRKAFEMIGPDQLRLRLETRRPEYGPQYARAAEVWILEQDAKKAALEESREAKKAALERSRYRMNLGWTIAGFCVAAVAAIAAIISAVPVVRGFFK